MSQSNQNLKQRLIQALDKFLALGFTITPLLGNKAPYRNNWQHEEALSKEALIREINSGRSKGLGIRTGRVSGGIVAVDLDGSSATAKLGELSGNLELPRTVAFTSGRPGRCQCIYTVPEQYWSGIQTKKFKTGATGEDGKPEQVELRWDGCQSVLPPSVHPITGQYQWVEGCAPSECEIALAPLWLIELMLVEPSATQQQSQPHISFQPASRISNHKNEQLLSNIDWALSYLQALDSNRADDYDEWLAVGMALHSVDDSLLSEWDAWSQQSSKYKAGVCDRKWHSFKRTGVSIGSLAHMAKSDGWTKPLEQSDRTTVKQYRCDRIHHHKHHAQKPDSRTDTGNTTPRRSVIESVTLRERITEVIGRNLSAADFTAALVELSALTGRQLRELTELATAIEIDLEIEETRSDRALEINRIQQIKQRSLTLDKYLPDSLAEPMTLVANWMGAPPAAFLVALLPTVASLLDPATRVIVKECIGFIEHPIIYAGIVTESGQRKSPILNAITDALRKLQHKEDERYQKLKTDYDTAKAKWDSLSAEQKFGQEPPVAPKKPREYYIDKATMEAVDTIKQNQPKHGILWLKDELSGLMASYGEYKNGRGGDKESMLSGWNGRGVKKNLKGGERISLSGDAMSVLGAIQDAKLQKMMGDFNDDQGDWARFLWLLIPLQALKLPSDDTTFQLAMLEDLYRHLADLSAAQYRFGTDAQRLYDNFHWRLEQRRVNEPRRGMRAALAKMEGYTARIALVLHIIWEVVAGNDTPSALIPRERVLAAMKLTEFFLGQVELIHVEGAAASGNELTPRLTAILEQAKQFGELTARKVQSAVSWLRTVAASKIRHDFLELARLGYGVCVGNGNRLKFIPRTVGSADCAAGSAVGSADSSKATESIENQGFVDLTVVSADSADVKRSLASNKDENPGEISDVFIPNYQHQHISSIVSNPELPSTTANNNLSAPASAPASDLLDNQLDDNTLDGGVVTNSEETLGSNSSAEIPDGTQNDLTARGVDLDRFATVETPLSATEPDDRGDNNTGISSSELQQWLDRIASVQDATECMDCLDALHHLPPPVTEQIWSAAAHLLPRFWEIAEIEAADESHQISGVGFGTEASAQQQTNQCESAQRITESEQNSGVGFGTQVSPQQLHQQCDSFSIATSAGVENPANHIGVKVKDLITGLWVSTLR